MNEENVDIAPASPGSSLRESGCSRRRETLVGRSRRECKGDRRSVGPAMPAAAMIGGDMAARARPVPPQIGCGTIVGDVAPGRGGAIGAPQPPGPAIRRHAAPIGSFLHLSPCILIWIKPPAAAAGSLPPGRISDALSSPSRAQLISSPSRFSL